MGILISVIAIGLAFTLVGSLWFLINQKPQTSSVPNAPQHASASRWKLPSFLRSEDILFIIGGILALGVLYWMMQSIAGAYLLGVVGAIEWNVIGTWITWTFVHAQHLDVRSIWQTITDPNLPKGEIIAVTSIVLVLVGSLWVKGYRWIVGSIAAIVFIFVVGYYSIKALPEDAMQFAKTIATSVEVTAAPQPASASRSDSATLPDHGTGSPRFDERARDLPFVQNDTVHLGTYGDVVEFYAAGTVTLKHDNPLACLDIGPRGVFHIISKADGYIVEITPKSGHTEYARIRVKHAHNCGSAG